MDQSYISVTEAPGTPISREQFQRLVNRYVWAAQYVRQKDVLEIACGAGPGLLLLEQIARSLTAGDVSVDLLNHALALPLKSATIKQFDALNTPFTPSTFDTIICFEAIYYFDPVGRFVIEARRLLRPGGYLLISTANKDLYDFNPSPHSVEYLGVVELEETLRRNGFSEMCFFGDTPMRTVSLRQRLLRPAKALAVKMGVLPRTMAGKALLKSLVFGPTISMPSSIGLDASAFPPQPIAAGRADHAHKVIFCAARKKDVSTPSIPV
jgi:SAM-dependent methyltransferase